MSTVLITGGHGGIGLECSRQIAATYGSNLLLAGRSPARMEQAAEKLRADYGAKVTTLPLDTSSLASVREAAARVKQMLSNGEIDSLQAVICNAGGRFDGPVSYSPEGYETTFATNYLGHFLLVELLIDHLPAQARIVFTASGTHDPDTADGKLVGIAIEPDAMALANVGKDGSKPPSAGVRYATSKLCMILQTYELHRRLQRSGSAIASIAFDPGSVLGTDLGRTLPRPVQWLARTRFMAWLMRRLSVTMGSLEFSGASLAKIAADPAFSGNSGKYLQSNDGRLIDAVSSKMSYDEQRALKLWAQSQALAGLREDEEAALLR